MTTHTRLRLGAAALVFLVVVLLSGAHLCGVAQDPGSRPLSTGALACTEFWLNRYQTLVGAAVAIAAAFAAYRMARRQVDKTQEQLAEMAKQTKMISYQSAAVRSDNIEAMLEYLDKFDDHIEIFEDLREKFRTALSEARGEAKHHRRTLPAPSTLGTGNRMQVSSEIVEKFRILIEAGRSLQESGAFLERLAKRVAWEPNVQDNNLPEALNNVLRSRKMIEKLIRSVESVGIMQPGQFIPISVFDILISDLQNQILNISTFQSFKVDHVIQAERAFLWGRHNHALSEIVG